MRTLFTHLLKNRPKFATFIWSLLISLGITAGAVAQTAIVRPHSTSDNGHVTNASRAINAIDNQYARLNSSTGLALGLGGHKGQLTVEFDHMVQAGTTTFVRIDEDKRLTEILLGGSLGNLLANLVDGLAFGDVSIEVEVYDDEGRIINRSSNDKFNDDEIRLITDKDGRTFLAITPEKAYHRIRISSVIDALLGFGRTFNLDVYDIFYYSGTQTCGGPMGTSYDVSGVNLDLLNLGGDLSENAGNAIDGDPATFSVLSPGVLNLAGAVHQHFYFPAEGATTDELKITLSVSQQLLNLSLLDEIDVILYNNNAVVFEDDIRSIGEGLLGIIDLDLLGLFSSGEPATFAVSPGVSFDRAEIRLGSLLSTSLSGHLRIHEISRTAARPSVNEADADGLVLTCSGQSVTLTAVPGVNTDEINWYDAPVGGTLLYTGNEFITDPITYKRVYYVSATADGCTEESVRVAVTVDTDKNPLIQLNGSSIFNVEEGETVQLPEAKAFNADNTPATATRWVALNGAPLSGTTAGPFSNPGIYSYRFEADGATCTNFIDVHVYVTDPNGCNFVYNRIYANDATEYTQSMLLGLPLGTVENVNNAGDADMSTFSVLDETINPLAGLLTGETSQTLKWHESVPSGTPVTVKIAREFETASVSGGIYVQAFRLGNPIGSRVLIDQHLVSALGGVNEFEYTFIPAEAGVFQEYDAIRVTLNSGIVNLTQRVRVYGAYYHQLSNTLADCSSGTIDILTGYESLISGLNVASTLTAVTDPANAVDGDLDTYAVLNNAVGANIKSKLDITFKQPALVGDSVFIKLGIPTGLLDLTVIENFSIQRYLGNQEVGEPIQFSNALLKLRLLSGSSTGVVTFENDRAFDRIKILSGGIVDALNALRIYEVKTIPVVQLPGTKYDDINDIHFVELCAGSSITLPADGCSDLRFFDAATGNNEITHAEIATWTAGTTAVVYVQIERFGCVVGEERQKIEIRVREVPQPVIMPDGDIHVRNGAQMILTIDNLTDYGTGVTFEWYKDGILIPGESGSTYEIDVIDTNADLGDYTAIAVLECKSEESAPVTLLEYDIVGWKSYTISSGEDFVSGAEEITYTIHVRNNSTAALEGLRISDELPLHTSYVAGSASNGGTLSGGVIEWTGVDVGAGATATVSFKVKVDANLIGVSEITNVALIFGDGSDPGTETFPPTDNDNPTDPDNSGDPGTDIPVVLISDLEVEKEADDARVVAGEETSFTVTITNRGPSYVDAGKNITILERPGTGVVITDYEVVSGPATITGTGNDATLTTTGVIAPNESVVIRVLASVQSSATGTITNGISVWNPDTPVTDPPNEDDTDPVPVDQSTDLAIVKTVDNYQPYINDNIEFTLAVTNNGPSDASNVVVTDELPDGYAYVSSSATQGIYDPATEKWTIGDLEAGESVTLTIVATVLSNGDYINYASVAGDEDDPDLTNNEDTPDDVVVPVDDSESRLVIVKNHALANGVDENQLEVTILDARGDGAQGKVITFTITRPDNSTETETITTDANGKALLSLTSTVPGEVEVGASTPGESISNSPRTVTFVVGAVDHDDSELVIIKDNAKADGTDENILEARIVDAAGHPIAAEEVEFTITGVNNNIQTRKVLTGADGIAELKLTSTRAGSVTVDAKVAGTAISGSPKTVTFILAVDLSVSKSADETQVVAGESTTFTITIRNNSTVTIPAGERILLEERPGAGVFITGFAVVTGSATVTGNGNNATVTTTGNLLTGAEIVVRVTADIAASASGTISNGISVRGPETDPDDTPDDEDDIPPVPVVSRTDLAVVKTVDNTAPFVGDEINFTVTVTNHGPSDASGVVVTDELPNGFDYASSSTTRGTYDPATDRWTIGNLESGQTVSLTIAATVLASGDYINYASVTGDEDDPDLTNNEDTPDDPVVPIDRSGSRLEIIKNNALANGIDENRLEATILDARGDGVADKVITFNITRPDNTTETETVTTDGDGKAMLSLTSAVPGQVKVEATTPDETISGSPRTVTFVLGVVDHAQSELVVVKDNARANGTDENILEARIVGTAGHPMAGVQVQFTITAVDNTVSTKNMTTGADGIALLRLTSSQAGTVTVAATVEGTAIKNSPRTVTFVLESADETDLSIVKTVDNFAPFIGSNVVFTLKVTNHGPGDATGVWVSDELPSGYTYVSSNASVGTYDPATDRWTIGDLGDGESAQLTITATVLESGDYINYATVTGDEDDPDLSNNEDTPDQPVVPQPVPDTSANLTITKVADEATVMAGGTTTFTLTITNTGPGILESGKTVRLEERPGIGVEIVSYAVESGNATVSGTGNRAVLTIDNEVPVSGIIVVKVTARITANAGSTITNGIAVRGPGKDDDDDPDDDDDTDPIPVDHELNIPNLFTPNGDGINDRFVIRGLQQYSQRELIVLNRWGTQVYSSRNYNNDWNGGSLPDGTYYYVLKVRNGGEWTIHRGPVAIIRNPTSR